VIRRWEWEGPTPAVWGRRDQLKQLFLNLLMNALDAMAEGGEITVGLRTAQQYGAASVVVEIADTGSGIPEALLERVFDRGVTTKAKGVWAWPGDLPGDRPGA
jgi:signal transduction histidine kinase